MSYGAAFHGSMRHKADRGAKVVGMKAGGKKRNGMDGGKDGAKGPLAHQGRFFHVKAAAPAFKEGIARHPRDSIFMLKSLLKTVFYRLGFSITKLRPAVAAGAVGTGAAGARGARGGGCDSCDSEALSASPRSLSKFKWSPKCW